MKSRGKLTGIFVSVALLALPIALGSCSSADEEDPVDLINEADKLIRYEIRNPEARAKAEKLYDRALHLVKPTTSDDDKFLIMTHGNFGLAMARMWDIFDFVASFTEGEFDPAEEAIQTGGTCVPSAPARIALDQEEPAPAVCPEDAPDITPFLPIVETVIENTLKPLIANLEIVDDYVTDQHPFEFWIEPRTPDNPSAFLAFGFDDLCNELGFDLSGRYDLTEVYIIRAIFKVIVGGADLLLGYEQLPQTLVDMATSLSVGKLVDIGNLPNIFNDPCLQVNPLLVPEFGILSERGFDKYAQIRGNFESAAIDLRMGIERLISDLEPTDDLYDDVFDRDDFIKGTLEDLGLLDQSSSYYNILDGFITNNTGTIEQVILDLAISIETSILSGGEPELAFHPYHSVGFKSLLETIALGFETNDLIVDVPAIDLSSWFRSPVGDLKMLFPEYQRTFDENGGIGYFLVETEDASVRPATDAIEYCLGVSDSTTIADDDERLASIGGDDFHDWGAIELSDGRTIQLQEHVDDFNCITDEIYFFFNDPSINGLLLKVIKNEDESYSTLLRGSFSNADLNRLMSVVASVAVDEDAAADDTADDAADDVPAE